MNKMRTDLELLKNLYLPEFQRLFSFATTIEKEISNESFWNNFNSILLSSKELNTDLADFFKEYIPDNFENLVDRAGKIRKEFLSNLANEFCNDRTNPSIELLLKNQNQEFLEEVSFEKDLITSVIHTERARLKKKLSLTDEALDFEIVDAEITSAFETIERQELKDKMKEWDNEPDFKPIQEKVGQSISKFEKKSKKNILSFIKLTIFVGFLSLMVWVILYRSCSTVNYTSKIKVIQKVEPEIKVSVGASKDTCNEKESIITNDPKFDSSFYMEHGKMGINKIEINKCYTVISYFYISSSDYIDGGWVEYSNLSYIKDIKNNRKYFFIKAIGIPLSPNKHYFKKIGEKLKFKIYFQKLNDNIHKIDIIECNDVNCFNFYGVSIKNFK